MKLDNRNKTFTIKEAIKSIVYQLRICKQKTTNVTPFQAHFGRKPNTPLSNISAQPKSSVKNFCKQHNINILPAPVNDHRAIGLVERLIQTIKRRLGCMKLDNRNKTFTIKEAIKSIVYQLRICKQKTTNVTPFQAHFGRKPNTPLSNISAQPKSSNLSYENILHHYLDADTVPVEDFLDKNG